MMSQLTCDVSVALDELMTKLTPAVIVPTERVPTVPPTVELVRKINELAVTAVVATVIVPATIAADLPTEAFAPVAICNLFPAVLKTRLPLVAVMFPADAVTDGDVPLAIQIPLPADLKNTAVAADVLAHTVLIGCKSVVDGFLRANIVIGRWNTLVKLSSGSLETKPTDIWDPG
jgi:hypothetical protein